LPDAEPRSPEETELLKMHERTGHPLGSEAFIDRLEMKIERSFKPKTLGRKKKKSKQVWCPQYR